MEGSFHYHSIIKSIRGRVIFYEDSDRLLFLNILRRFVDKYGVTLVEFVLMDNHIHILHTAQSKKEAQQFISELQQNFSYWYNRFHSSKDTMFVPAKIYPKNREEMVTKCALYILQNPMVASRDAYPHPKDYKWSSYRFHYSFMKGGRSLVKDPSQIMKLNYMSRMINSSRSIYKNACPLMRENFSTTNITLADILSVNTFEVDKLYTPDEFKIILQKFIISFQEEYAEELLKKKMRYFKKHKVAVARASNYLIGILGGRNYNSLTREEKTDVITKLLSCSKISVIQVVMLLDEDKAFVSGIYRKLKYK